MKKIILAIGAHPDDIEIGCGGTLALLKNRGHDLVHLVVTSGEEGDFSKARDEVVRIREKEARLSAKILGVSELIFLREKDGLTGYTKEAKMKLTSILRTVRPDIVFTHARSDHFPDHQVVHQLTTAAILAAAGPWYPDAGASTHQVSELYGYEVWNPISEYQLSVDISSAIEQKTQSIQVHQSQVSQVNYAEAIRGLANYRGVMSMTGTYAEVFEVLRVGSI